MMYRVYDITTANCVPGTVMLGYEPASGKRRDRKKHSSYRAVPKSAADQLRVGTVFEWAKHPVYGYAGYQVKVIAHAAPVSRSKTSPGKGQKQ